MFDKDFIFGLAVLAGVLISGFVLSQLFDADFFIVALCMMLIVWGVLWWVDRYYSKSVSQDESLVFCEWGGRLNQSDFLADTKMTRLDLQEIGFSPSQRMVMNSYLRLNATSLRAQSFLMASFAVPSSPE